LRESVSQSGARSLANADHLAKLHAIWHDETTRLEAERHRRLFLAELPSEYAAGGLTSAAGDLAVAHSSRGPTRRHEPTAVGRAPCSNRVAGLETEAGR
jgi:hypothetical protein